MNRDVVTSPHDQWPPAWLQSPAVRAGPFVFTSGLVDATTRGDDLLDHPVRRQSEAVVEALGAVLEGGGSSLDLLVKLGTYHRDLDDTHWHMQPRRRLLGAAAPPSTAFECGLLPPAAEVAVDGVALAADSRLEREVVVTDRAPTPRAPYAQAVKAGPLVFTAGFMATDLRTGVAPAARVPEALPRFHSAIKRQTEWVLETLGAVLDAAGSSLDRVVRGFAVLTDMDDFFAFDEVWRAVFGAGPPARTVVEGAIFNPGCRVEIELVALAGDADLRCEAISAPSVPVPTVAEAQAVRAGEWVFVSGLLPTDFATGIAPEARVDPSFPRYATAVDLQARYVLSNLARILEAAGTDLAHVVRLGVYHTDLRADFLGAAEARRESFPSGPPAATTIQVDALAVPGARLMVDAVAVLA